MIKVILCTYNGESYIEEQLKSILSQTLRVDVIDIFDDRSTDGTLDKIRAIAARYEGENAKILIRVNHVNKGYISNFSYAIKSCSHQDEYVFLCDQDDVWEEDKVEMLLGLLKKYDGVPALAFTDAKLIGTFGNDLSYTLWRSIGFDISKDVNYELTRRNVVTGATVALNYALIEVFKKKTKVSKFLPHDYCLAVLASSYGIIIPVNKPLTQYRLHGNNQIGTSPSFLKRIKKVFFDRKGATLNSELGKFSELMEITKAQDPEKYSAFKLKYELYSSLLSKGVYLSPFILWKYKTPFKAAIKIMRMSIMRYQS
ncbi:glycosyltransferase [Aeromonas media]|uniref:glycosyltransferase n=1 Tax=Aeromonas media TaxID=651 RepID=UPI0009DCDE88|nr:glycosyltransferase [Aeromonas media]